MWDFGPGPLNRVCAETHPSFFLPRSEGQSACGTWWMLGSTHPFLPFAPHSPGREPAYTKDKSTPGRTLPAATCGTLQHHATGVPDCTPSLTLRSARGHGGQNNCRSLGTSSNGHRAPQMEPLLVWPAVWSAVARPWEREEAAARLGEAGPTSMHFRERKPEAGDSFV